MSASIPSGPTKQRLSPPRRRLVELMQRLHFGRIENLRICNREPVLDPSPRIVRDIKLASDDVPRKQLASRDFLLKDQVVELLHQFDQIGHGIIDEIEVKNGLPFRLIKTEVP